MPPHAHQPTLQDRLRGWTWWIKEALLPDYVSPAAPIIIGGCGRSGTTLLQVILDNHPELACVRESAILQPGKLNTAKLAARVGLPPGRLAELARTSRRHPQFVERVFAELLERTGKSHWAEKSPRNVRRLAYVFRHFPAARFVHVLRDGRDVVCSLRTHPRFKRVGDQVIELDTWNPIEDCVQRWVKDVSAGLEWSGHPGYRELRYEELAADPEGTLGALFEWLGVGWSPEVLRFHEQRDRRAPKDPRFARPVNRSSVGRWRRDLSKEDVDLVKARAGPLLRRLGYTHDDDWDGGTGSRMATTTEATA